jgi:hypothetical protein
MDVVAPLVCRDEVHLSVRIMPRAAAVLHMPPATAVKAVPVRADG